MTTDDGTTSDLKMALIDHISAILDDLEMNDGSDSGMSDAEIVEMHERNMDIAGFLIGSLGLSDASKEAEGYSVRVNPMDPHTYVDEHLA